MLSSSSDTEELSPVAGICGIIVEEPLNVDEAEVFRPACPLIAIDNRTTSKLADVILEEGQSLDALCESMRQSPIASATLVQLTRNNEQRSIFDGLFAESLAYSTLQHSKQFEAWLHESKPNNTKHFTNEPILAKRLEDKLYLTLNRPENRNAWSTAMRDALVQNLQVALIDDSISSVFINANGPSFCAGGDLTEFGSARDAGEAHVTRQTRSPAWLMHLLADKLQISVQGACVGAGIELPAFASHIVANPNAFFQLPEVNFGLIPGAGGSASILSRIGRSRFNYMALTGERIDANTALSWNLIDAISESTNDPS